ncbi:XRE family transcriptional regulator [Pseudoroseomonas wenyumeiae]|uniref:XRE family transcriptional regulator n=2 Tax=Teichococcus wenyumeiae TaxID=2478470 RepID=A0A3A9JCM1_9PROT|nr:XRE family transcriptional regulator [Pseudoroseomonas wenyumeiae]RMI24915.1 XRE family transcriptional regulator [Pseudoroseomonas wenyumeiae]
MSIGVEDRLGAYLKARRTRLDPAALGFATQRRRTAGLRREEVAQRANISVTWYTWLEQGRGGAPSADVLDRIARALMLTDIEREHLFLLGLGRPPEVRYRAAEGVSPRLQRLLDALEFSPAIIKTATWDIVAWNRAAVAVLTDYGALPPDQRNVLRLMFGQSQVRAAQHDWESVARFVVGAFRADAARAGALSEVRQLVEELCRTSPEFEALWRENDVGAHGGGTKRLRHPTLGMLELEYSSFALEERPDLGMIVYNPVSPADAALIRTLMTEQKSAT